MSESSYIGAILLAAFILFLAAKGRLTAYTNVLWGNTAAPAPAASSGSSSGILGTIGTAISLGTKVAEITG